MARSGYDKGLALKSLQANLQGWSRILLLALVFQLAYASAGFSSQSHASTSSALANEVCGRDGVLKPTPEGQAPRLVLHDDSSCQCCLPLTCGGPALLGGGALPEASSGPPAKIIFVSYCTNMPAYAQAFAQPRAPPQR
jgi:hypothetical protein